MKKIMLVFGIFLLSISLVLANGDHQTEIEEGKKLVDRGISCDKLTDEQLEAIGEYYMEQMHPGESHEAMHEMMGIEEGTEYHEQFHVNIAKMMYCGESGNMMGGGMMGSGGMMGMMPMMMNMMMGGGMMNMMMRNNMMSSGTIGGNSAYYDYNNLLSIFSSVFLIAFIFLIIWLVYKFTKKQEEFETPVSIIKKRYAEGKINKKQFKEMQKELKE